MKGIMIESNGCCEICQKSYPANTLLYPPSFYECIYIPKETEESNSPSNGHQLDISHVSKYWENEPSKQLLNYENILKELKWHTSQFNKIMFEFMSDKINIDSVLSVYKLVYLLSRFVSPCKALLEAQEVLKQYYDMVSCRVVLPSTKQQ